MDDHQQNTQHHVLSEASDWFARLHDDAATDADKQAWQDWLNSDQRHQQAWAQVEQITGSIYTVSDIPKAKALIKQPPSQYRSATSLASICLIVSTSFLAFSIFDSTSPELKASNYQTAIGETREIILQDGSQVWINTGSEINVLFTNESRSISLVEGEIFIKTAKDNTLKRSFNVSTDNGTLTPLGTEFSVKKLPEETELNVYQGAVMIEAQYNHTAFTLHAGKQTSFSDTTINHHTHPVSLARRAWTNGLLIADQTPLCDFIADLKAYTSDEIICSDDVNQFQLVGSYPINDVNAVMSAIESSLPIHIWRVNPTTLRIDKHI